MALFTLCRSRLPWMDGSNGSPPYFLTAKDPEGNFLLAMYIPPLAEDNNSYDETYENERARNRFPAGYKLMTYNGIAVPDLLDTEPPGTDFFVNNLSVF